MATDFAVEVVRTRFVPRLDDSSLTYDNHDDRVKRCKLLESCVLYIDIRESAKISAEWQPDILARIYSSFVRAMLRSARHFGGHVRNIIGDRVMVVFDQEDCFSNAVRTAILMNTVVQRVLDARIDAIPFRCGIGIDYGPMLATKAGTIRKGAETEFYRSLVWLGEPANVASRLTDIAGKTVQTEREPRVKIRRHGTNSFLEELLLGLDVGASEFLNQLQQTDSPKLLHTDPRFRGFSVEDRTATVEYPPILMTKAVFDGYKEANPGGTDLRTRLWKPRRVSLSGFSGVIWGGNVVFG